MIPERVDIRVRNKTQNMKKFGHWEADTVVTCRGGQGCLAVFVEKLFYLVVKMPDKTAKNMEKAAISALSGKRVLSITFDNGTENVLHKKIAKALNCKTYFCDAYCSYQKGLIENRNKILRQYLPKKTDFQFITEKRIAEIQDAINSKAMKKLNWNSPTNAFTRLMKNL